MRMQINSLKGLGSKLLVLVGLPFTAFLVIALIFLINSRRSVILSEQLLINQRGLQHLSELIGNLQRERDLSALYINNGTEGAPVTQQQGVVDQTWSSLKDSASKSSYFEELTSTLETSSAQLTTIRKSVIEKSESSSNVIKTYSAIVEQLMRIYSASAQYANNHGEGEVGAKILGIILLEEAREYGSQLRGTLSSILAKDSPINQDNFTLLGRSKSGLNLHLSSPALELSAEIRQLLERYKEKLEWVRIEELSQSTIRSADDGEWGEDAKLAFEQASVVVGDVSSILKTEQDSSEQFIQASQKRQNQIFGYVAIAVFTTAILLALAYWVISSRVKKSLMGVTENIRSSSSSTNLTSGELVDVSKKLASASAQQAAAIQETVATLNEINATLSNSLENANRSTQEAEDSYRVAEDGKSAIQKMIKSIQEISQSNDQIVQQVEASQNRFAEIIQFINEIGNKTKIINDIVFQTKLLSFNASVESARAGDHGKGFAVVAQEIGNLAQISGNAAKEINDMLAKGIDQVEDIVGQTKNQVGGLVLVSRSKVEEGTKVAEECDASIEAIVGKVWNVNNMIKNISESAKEQLRAVSEITSSMQELDKVTQANSETADQTASHSAMMSDLAGNLTEAVSALEEEVLGKRAS